MATLPRTGLTDTFIDGVTPLSGAEIEAVHKWVERQGIGSLLALGAGVAAGFEVTEGSGLNVDIAAGSGIALHNTYGAVFLQKTVGSVLALADNSVLYVFATISVNPPTNDSRYDALPVFASDSGASLNGGLLLAKVTTAGGAVTDVVDMRSYVIPDVPPEELGFAYDAENTAGLDYGYKAGRLRVSDGSLVAVAAGFVTLADDQTSYVEIDDTGTVAAVAEGDGWTPTKRPLARVVTAGGLITSATDMRVGFDFNDIPSGAVTSVTATVDGGLEIAGTANDPTVGIAAGGVSDAMLGDRTIDDTLATPLSTGPVTSLLSWLAGRIKAATGGGTWDATPDTTLADAKTHIDAAAPHSGHLAADGSVVATGNLDMGGGRVVNAGASVDAADLVTRAELDAVSGGVKVRTAVHAMATGDVTVSNPGTAVFDNVTLSAGQYLLLANQTTSSENGVYEFNGSGVALTRRADLDVDGELVNGVYVLVLAGTQHRGEGYVVVTADPITVDTTGIEWSKFLANAGGEVNVGVNAGSEGTGVYDGKSGVNLGFRNLVSKNSLLTIALNAGNKTIEFTVNQASLALNSIGGVLGVTKGGTGLSAISAAAMIYASAANTLAQLAPNATTTRKFLRQKGDGATPEPPQWDTLLGSDLPVFGPSGASHAPGAVPDPGATAGTARFMREDRTWAVPPNAGGFVANSSTSETIPTVNPTAQAWLIGSGYAFSIGQRVRICRVSAPTTWQEGVVTLYTGGVLSVAVDRWNGSGGPFTDWQLFVTGQPGLDGADGADGAGGAGAFTDLTDAPAAYTGQGGKLVAVNGAETGVEFVAAAIGDMVGNNNLGEITDPATARTNLGLGDAATANIGTAPGDVADGDDSRLSDTRDPNAHAASHASAGSDPIAIDALGAASDTTDLDATASAHGLCPKLSGSASDAFRGDGTFGAVAATVDINGTTEETTAADADELLIYDASAAANRKMTRGNLFGERAVRTINFVIDGGGVEIADGIAGDVMIDFACEIEQVTLLADQSGSIVVDIWSDTYANYPATDADSITASAPPTISSATKSQDATLTGWTTAIAAGDILRFNVDSCTTIERVTVVLKVRVS